MIITHSDHMDDSDDEEYENVKSTIIQCFSGNDDKLKTLGPIN